MLDAAVASKRKRQQLDRLLTVTAPRERVMLAGIAVLLSSIFFWALFGRVEHAVMLDGIIVESGVRHDAVTVEPGHLLEFLAAPGDRVEAGDPIARQSVPHLEREVSELRDRVGRLEAGFAPGAGAGLTPPPLDSARVALLQAEARRAAREVIVSQGGGEVMALRSAPGDYLPAGAPVAQIRAAPDGEGRPVQAVLRVAPRVAGLIRPGMRASVEVATAGGEALGFSGEVAAVAAGPLPGWLAALRPPTAESMHRVDIALHPAPEAALPDGAACRVRVVLGRKPPVALLVAARP